MILLLVGGLLQLSNVKWVLDILFKLHHTPSMHPTQQGTLLRADQEFVRFLPSLMKTGNRQTPSAILDALESHNHRRKQFLHACFINLRLDSDLSGADLSSPSLSKLHLICPKPQDLRDLTTSLRMISDQPIQKDGLFTIHGGNDSFLLETRLLSLDSIKDEYDAPEATGNSTHVIVHSVRTPPLEAMPHFDTLLYFQELERQQERWEHKGWGHILLYGEVVTSTNTILDRYMISPTYNVVFDWATEKTQQFQTTPEAPHRVHCCCN